jgi:hypothetical protein
LPDAAIVPDAGSNAVTPWYTHEFASAYGRPFPFLVITCSSRGPLTAFRFVRTEINSCKLCPSIGP